ncbi:MAG: MFS transporter [Myxococcota bacterium]
MSAPRDVSAPHVGVAESASAADSASAVGSASTGVAGSTSAVGSASASASIGVSGAASASAGDLPDGAGAVGADAGVSVGAAKFTPYQRKLFWFLSVACFFEGYDFFALSQLLPNLRAHFGLSPSEGGILVGATSAGTMLAFAIIGLADRWGRKRVLTLTIAGYTLFTLFSGLAPNAVAFGLFQLVARTFLIGEWATSMVIAAEEYPAQRRGLVIGVVSAAAALGSIVCAGVVPALLKTPLGWRSVYLVGVLPLVLVAFARRSLRETTRFEELSAERVRARARAAQAADEAGLMEVFRKGHTKRVLQMGAIWFFCYVCTQNAVMFWKEFAVGERALSDADVGKIVAISALGSLPLAFSSGYFLDKVGRRVGGTVILGILILGVLLSYTAHSKLALTVGLLLATVGLNTTLTLLNTLTTELFPTALRGGAFAWSNNLIGRVGYLLSPVAIGFLAEQMGWGAVVRSTAIFPVLACLLIWVWLPETRGRELEETAGRAA